MAIDREGSFIKIKLRAVVKSVTEEPQIRSPRSKKVWSDVTYVDFC